MLGFSVSGTLAPARQNQNQRQRRRPLAEQLNSVNQLPVGIPQNPVPGASSEQIWTSTIINNAKTGDDIRNTRLRARVPCWEPVIEGRPSLLSLDDDTPSDLRRLERGWREKRKIRVEFCSSNDIHKDRKGYDARRHHNAIEEAIPLSAVRRSEAGRRRISTCDIDSSEQNNTLSLPPSSSTYLLKQEPFIRPLAEPRPKKDSKPIINVRFSSSTPSILPTPPSTPPLSPISRPSTRRLSLHKAENDLVPLRETLNTSSSPPAPHRSDKLEPTAQSLLLPVVEPGLPEPLRLDSRRRPLLNETVSQVRGHGQSLKQHFNPIISHPLPPTYKPVPMSKGHSDTIFIHQPSSSLELTLRLQGGRTIDVYKGGEKVRFIDRLPTKDKGNRVMMKKRVIRLGQWKNWGEEATRDWRNLSGVVDEFKRLTPRIKLYHPLGHMTITCSSPPDVIINFRFETEPKLVHSTAFSNANAIGKSNGTPSRTRNVDWRDPPWPTDDIAEDAAQNSSSSWTQAMPKTRGRTVKLRILYSRSKKEIQLDIDRFSLVENVDEAHKQRTNTDNNRMRTRSNSTERGRENDRLREQYRSKRTAPLISSPLQSSDLITALRPPYPALAREKADSNRNAHAGDGDAKDELEGIAASLGILVDIQGWNEEEKDALSRLWALRSEWSRWG
ncbi:hypothetical protein IAT40_000023 [Kwoniella sp. CBS 6097]